MKAILVALGCAVTLAGCAGTSTLKSANGDDVAVNVITASKAWVEERATIYSGKLSPDFYDFPGQFFARYVADFALDASGKEPGIGLASSVRNASMTLATSDLLLRSGTLGSTGFFSKSFNVTGILLGAISPRSPEEQFVSKMKANYERFLTGSVTFIRVDRLDGKSSVEDLHRTFDERFGEMRVAAKRTPGLACERKNESLVVGYYRSSYLMPLDCKLDSVAFKYLRKSEVVADGSVFQKIFGPSVVSRLTLTEVPASAIKDVVEKHQRALGPEWIPVYPEVGPNAAASKIVVGWGDVTKTYSPPARPFSS